MCSRCPDAPSLARPAPTARITRPLRRARLVARIALAACLSATAFANGAAAERELRVCADPDNLPFSHADESGFENRIARLIADAMHARLSYAWLPQIRGYVRKTMGAGLCDVFIGVPVGLERVATTRPYYRSGYMFVFREGSPLRSFDDPRLSRLRIGVQLVGNDLAATPPGHALVRRGATDNVTGFLLLGERPAGERMTAAIAAGELDAGVLWGPQAGWFARHAPVPLAIAPARAPADLAGIPFEFGIAMGVRRGDDALRAELDAILLSRRSEIDAILAAYSVPRTDLPRAGE